MRPREIFLSHSTVDRALADRLIRALEGEGLRVWFAPYHLVGSQRWYDEIGKALRRCDWFVLLISKASMRSRWVKYELQFALDEARFEDRIVPVLAEDCNWKKPYWTLVAIQRVDFRAGFEQGLVELLRIWAPRRTRDADSRVARGRKRRRRS